MRGRREDHTGSRTKKRVVTERRRVDPPPDPRLETQHLTKVFDDYSRTDALNLFPSELLPTNTDAGALWISGNIIPRFRYPYGLCRGQSAGGDNADERQVNKAEVTKKPQHPLPSNPVAVPSSGGAGDSGSASVQATSTSSSSFIPQVTDDNAATVTVGTKHNDLCAKPSAEPRMSTEKAATEYRAEAERIRRQAQAAKDEIIRRQLLVIAAGYDQLAKTAAMIAAHRSTTN